MTTTRNVPMISKAASNIIDVAHNGNLVSEGGILSSDTRDLLNSQIQTPRPGRLVSLLCHGCYLEPSPAGFKPTDKEIPDPDALRQELVGIACDKLAPADVFTTSYLSLGAPLEGSLLAISHDLLADDNLDVDDDRRVVVEALRNIGERAFTELTKEEYDRSSFESAIHLAVNEGREKLDKADIDRTKLDFDECDPTNAFVSGVVEPLRIDR